MPAANQAVTPGRTTLLEAVNVLLATIGEAPVATLEDEANAEAVMAERTILEFHKEGQVRGWSWNREGAFRYLRDISTNEIVVPANVVSFAPCQYEHAHRYQLRGLRVYDTQERSFEHDIPWLEADIVTLLPWDDCPEPYNRWVTIRSGRVFSDRVLSSDSIARYTSEHESKAWAVLLQAEDAQSQPNVLTGGPGLSPFPTFSPGYGLGGRRGAGILRRG
jgi:hypothetical protein